MSSSNILSHWSQSSGCKQVGTDGECTSKIPSLYHPSCHLVESKQRILICCLLPVGLSPGGRQASIPIRGLIDINIILILLNNILVLIYLG